MEKEKFRKHLTEATHAVLELTANFCFNTLSENTEYLIVPNSRDKSDHLDRLECNVLNIWNENANRVLSFEKIVGLLCHEDRVPLWIDISVYKSTKKKTVIELLCSRRLRKEEELMHRDKISPFSTWVALPSSYNENCKFDINWRVKSKLYLKFSHSLYRIKCLLG